MNGFYCLLVCILVSHICHGRLQTILGSAQIDYKEDLVNHLVQLLIAINSEIAYDHIVFVKDVAQREGCIFEDAVHRVNKPIIAISRPMEPNSRQANQASSNFVLVTCSLGYWQQSDILNSKYQYVPHVIWLNEKEMQEAGSLCSTIHRLGLLQNLIVAPQSLLDGGAYLSCDLHGSLGAIDFKTFVKPALSLRGLTITTESDQLPPRSILYYNSKGQLRLTGFVANFLKAFAERYGAELVLVPPAKMGVTVHYDSLVNKTFQGLLDIAAVVARYKLDTANESYSYPVELMEYCYMIPLPHVRPANNVFFDIIEVKAMLVILIYFVAFGIFVHIGRYRTWKGLSLTKTLCNDKSFRGLLSQSFVMPRETSLFMKYILFLLCYCSILLCTSYQAYLQSHLVHPSLEKRMQTYEDIRQNNYKIVIDDRESMYISHEILQRHHDLFVKKGNFYRFLKLRDSMDVRYIFPVSRTRWSVFRERQTIFQRKLFYYSSQLCLSSLVLLSFPLKPGLPYKMQFDQHLLDIRDTGLLDCWLERNFLVMVRLKLSSFKDLSTADAYGPKLNLNDFLWIWVSYAVCVLSSFLVFAAELLSNKFKREQKLFALIK